jgi:hypothetical protein
VDFLSAAFGHLDFAVRGATLLAEIFAGGVYVCVANPILTIVVYVNLDRASARLEDALTDMQLGRFR